MGPGSATSESPFFTPNSHSRCAMFLFIRRPFWYVEKSISFRSLIGLGSVNGVSILDAIPLESTWALQAYYIRPSGIFIHRHRFWVKDACSVIVKDSLGMQPKMLSGRCCLLERLSILILITIIRRVRSCH